MTATPVAPPVEALLELAVRHVNAGQRERAVVLCEHALATHAPHPGVLQLLALLTLQRGDAAQALCHAQASLALRPDHLPTRELAADAWFQRAMAHQAARDHTAEADALRQVLRLVPGRAEAEVNLGIVMQESGALDEAMQAYGRAYRLRPDTFGRIAHALAAAPHGRIWLRLDDLRAALLAA